MPPGPSLGGAPSGKRLREKLCSADPLPTILSLEEVELSDPLDRPETTSINPTRTTMIRPGATVTTDRGTRRPIDPSVRPELENEATVCREQNRLRDGTNPISHHATERTRFPMTVEPFLTERTRFRTTWAPFLTERTRFHPISESFLTERTRFRRTTTRITRRNEPDFVARQLVSCSRNTESVSPQIVRLTQTRAFSNGFDAKLRL